MRVPFGKQKSDAVLLERLAIGDQKAFQSLIQKYLPYILKTAERMTGDASLAEDIAQDVMIKLWDKAPEWDERGPAVLKTWLYRVTVNLCIDKQRGKKHLPIEHIELLPSLAKDAVSHVHEKQLEDIIQNLFYELTEQQRFVIVLSYYEGLGATEIAEIMELSTGAVSGLLHRARNTLKIKLSKLGIEGWADDKNNR
ncbi:sigma-70 family RNA polymerase sigma factor [Terasakiella sp. SH-1]|uniref:sigma-70 family RNA polymerase sigma factor n=1 Tax=Terasakiella sp. SH-1 TaxID=2560057 RepID=UPI00107393E6|nr:sigma-70 family RNA polymerase sigma factor [Terasakiella sp. SH-1]